MHMYFVFTHSLVNSYFGDNFRRCLTKLASIAKKLHLHLLWTSQTRAKQTAGFLENCARVQAATWTIDDPLSIANVKCNCQIILSYVMVCL